MKRVNIILIALFLLLSAGQLWAQQDRAIWHSMSESPRRAWSTFDGDTVRYLEFNYTIRSRAHSNRTIGEIIDELELPVIGIVCIMSTVGNSNAPGRVRRLTLGIRQHGDTHSPIRDYNIEIGLKNPLTVEEWIRIASGREITPGIRNLRVSGTCTNPFIIRDPELSERRRRQVEESERRGREAAERNERRRQERERENRNRQ